MLSCRPSIALFGQRSLGFACRSSSLTRLRGGGGGSVQVFMGQGGRYGWAQLSPTGHSIHYCMTQSVVVTVQSRSSQLCRCFSSLFRSSLSASRLIQTCEFRRSRTSVCRQALRFDAPATVVMCRSELHRPGCLTSAVQSHTTHSFTLSVSVTAGSPSSCSSDSSSAPVNCRSSVLLSTSSTSLPRSPSTLTSFSLTSRRYIIIQQVISFC